MTQPAQPAQSLILARCRCNDAGHPLGLRNGDILLAVDGSPWHGSASELQDKLARSQKPPLLSFQRGDAVFAILSDRADLGQWDRKPVPEPLHPPVPADDRLRNWEIWADLDRNHDLFPARASWLALIAPPLWLAKSRLWAGLGLFGAVLALCLPVGPWLMAGVWICTGFHLWREGAAHRRVALQMQGLVRQGVIAARSEADAIAGWCKLFPEARFRFAQTVTASAATGAQPESELG